MLKFLDSKKTKYILLLILIILISAPYLIAYLYTPTDNIFTGFVFQTVDNFTYISKMTNAEKGFAFLNNYSLGDNYGGYHFLFYVLLGKLALLLHIPYVLMFHLSRLVLAVIFLFVLYDLLDVLGISNIRKQNVIVCTVLFTGNFQWVSAIFSYISNVEISNGYTCAELIPQLYLTYVPHFILNVILLMKVLKYTVLYKDNRVKNGIIISILLLVSALVHPFSAITFGIYSGSYILWQDIINKRASLKNFLLLLIFAIAPLPYLVYSLYAFIHYETLIEWNKQATLSLGSLDIRVFVQGVFLILPYLLILIKSNWKNDRNILTWFLSLSICLSFLPFGSSSRILTEGSGLYCTVLLGLLIYENYEKINIDQSVKVFLIFLLFFSSIWTVIEPIFLVRNVATYISKERYEAYQYIKDNVAYNDLIFSDYNTELLIPSYTGNRVVMGHHHESQHFQEWIDRWVDIVRTGDLSELQKYHIKYYLVDKKGEYPSPFKVPTKDCSIIFQNTEFILYKIDDGGSK
jgi:hypothetical protein